MKNIAASQLRDIADALDNKKIAPPKYALSAPLVLAAPDMFIALCAIREAQGIGDRKKSDVAMDRANKIIDAAVTKANGR